MKTVIEEHRFTKEEVLTALGIKISKSDILVSFSTPPKRKSQLLIIIQKSEAKK
jgi:hypothetical protein